MQVINENKKGLIRAGEPESACLAVVYVDWTPGRAEVDLFIGSSICFDSDDNFFAAGLQDGTLKRGETLVDDATATIGIAKALTNKSLPAS